MTDKAPSPTVTLNVRIAPELKQRLRAWAREHGLSDASATALMINAYIHMSDAVKDDTE